MKLHRIYAVILRHVYNFRHSLDRMSDVFYWPAVDLILWGITSSYVKATSPNGSQFVLIVISGILLWLLTWRAQYEITVSLLSEIWDKNLINLFVSPLQFSEWIVALLSLGIMKAIISLSWASILAYFLYHVGILPMGLWLIPFGIVLIMSGWTIGLLVASVIIRWGTKVQTFAWTAAWAVAPFAAIYFPVKFLPLWAQKVSLFVPMSYVFEGSRELLLTNKLDIQNLFISFGITLVYFIIALFVLRRNFNKVLERGLNSVY